MELENSPDAEDSVKDNFSVKLGEASDHIPKSKIVDTSKEQMSAKSAPVNNPKGRHLLGESRDLKKYTENSLAGQPSFCLWEVPSLNWGCVQPFKGSEKDE